MPNPSEMERIEQERVAGAFDPGNTPPRYEVRETVLQTSRFHVVDQVRFGYVAAWCRERDMADHIATLLNLNPPKQKE